MNKKDNQRTRLSKLLLKNAVLELLQEKRAVNKITVKELCERAELNRSTFYAHYNDPKEIINEIENDILASTALHLQKIGEGNSADARVYINSFLKYIKDNDMPIRILLFDGTDTDFKSRFMQQSVARFIENNDMLMNAETEQFIYAYILNGSYGIILQWIRSNYAVPESTITELLFSINDSALRNLHIASKKYGK